MGVSTSRIIASIVKGGYIFGRGWMYFRLFTSIVFSFWVLNVMSIRGGPSDTDRVVVAGVV